MKNQMNSKMTQQMNGEATLAAAVMCGMDHADFIVILSPFVGASLVR